ncbi:MAG: sigma-70 family RNA polymerase sigma factor [Lachnospiraceae bacterium]|nr:sigma-70 family RNA polymerase sigma factor [Lachnospiraceae bacterium]
MKYESMTDDEIIKQIRKQDDEAMEYMLKKYSGIVKRETRTLYLIGAEMEDLAQEGMIGLFKAIRDYKPDSPAGFATFANICVRGQIRTAIQTSNRKKHAPLNEYISLYANKEEDGGVFDYHEAESVDANPENILIAKEQQRLLEMKIHSLLSNYENHVWKLFLNGLSYADIANRLGKTEKSVNNALQRIRTKLSSSAG